MSSKKKHKPNPEHEKPFSFHRYQRDLESALKTYRLIENWDEFWKFVNRVEALHLSKPSDEVLRRLPLRVTVTVHSLAKRVESRELTDERLEIFLVIVQAFLAFKQTEKFNRLRKLRLAQKALPVAAYKNAIVDVLGKQRVLIVAGDTGCGKSTQVC